MLSWLTIGSWETVRGPIEDFTSSLSQTKIDQIREVLTFSQMLMVLNKNYLGLLHSMSADQHQKIDHILTVKQQNQLASIASNQPRPALPIKGWQGIEPFPPDPIIALLGFGGLIVAALIAMKARR
jgi:hypothetical protein